MGFHPGSALPDSSLPYTSLIPSGIIPAGWILATPGFTPISHQRGHVMEMKSIRLRVAEMGWHPAVPREGWRMNTGDARGFEQQQHYVTMGFGNVQSQKIPMFKITCNLMTCVPNTCLWMQRKFDWGFIEGTDSVLRIPLARQCRCRW